MHVQVIALLEDEIPPQTVHLPSSVSSKTDLISVEESSSTNNGLSLQPTASTTNKISLIITRLVINFMSEIFRYLVAFNLGCCWNVEKVIRIAISVYQIYC